MQFRDHMTYDRKQPQRSRVRRRHEQQRGRCRKPVDRTKPDAGWNRSAFQKFVQLVHDTNGVTACNKQGAVLHAQGVPIAGQRGLLLGLSVFLQPRRCRRSKSARSSRSTTSRSSTSTRSSARRRSTCDRTTCATASAGIGAATVDMMQQSSGITGFWDPTSSHTLRPRPQFLSRQVYFDIDNDSPNSGDLNYTTNHFSKT